jgi:hypothetical protein
VAGSIRSGRLAAKTATAALKTGFTVKFPSWISNNEWPERVAIKAIL